MIKVLLNNLPLKITALIIGIVIWFYAVTSEIATLFVEVPLNVKVPGKYMLLSNIPDKAVLSVVGNRRGLMLLNMLKPLSIEIDVKKKEGLYFIYLDTSMVKIPVWLNIKVKSILSPKTLRIKLNPVQEKVVRVKVPKGYKSFPAQVSITGAKSAIKKIKYIYPDSIPKKVNKVGLKLPVGIIKVFPDSVKIIYESSGH